MLNKLNARIHSKSRVKTLKGTQWLNVQLLCEGALSPFY